MLPDSDAGWDTVGLLCCKGILLAHVQLDVHQNPWILLCQGAFQLVIPPQVQDSAFPFA